MLFCSDAVSARIELQTARRPEPGDRQADQVGRSRQPASDASRRHRFGQNIYDCQCDPRAWIDPRSSFRTTKRWRRNFTRSSSSSFPHNAVEYFVSYFDYYQPEAYIPRSDTYIEKDSSINEEIERLAAGRHQRAAFAPRHDCRGERFLHLRRYLAGRLRTNAAHGETRSAHSDAKRFSAAWSRCFTSATI